MSYLSALFLGLVQGVTEFLPVSSSGHLSILQNFFHLSGADGNDLFFDVLLHFGTLGAVIAAYRREFRALLRELFSMLRGRRVPRGDAERAENRRMVFLLIIATLPLFLILPVKDRIEALYNNTIFIGAALIITGILLFYSDRSGHGGKTARNATVGDALVVGISQALATAPGLSRSGTTISFGLFSGFDREFAVAFSFLLSIPAVLGANILSLIHAISAGIVWANVPAYLVGVAAAALSGYASLRLLRRLSRKGGFGGFAYYCWGVGGVTLLLSLIR